MKFIALSFMFIFVIACGKENTSGKSGSINNYDSNNYSLVQEEQTRSDFIKRGKNVIKNYGASINLYFGRNISSQMTRILVSENIYVTESVIYRNGHYSDNEPTSVSVHNSQATLYVGQQYPRANWNTTIKQDKQSDRSILHTMLEMVGIDDTNYQYSNQIISKRR